MTKQPLRRYYEPSFRTFVNGDENLFRPPDLSIKRVTLYLKVFPFDLNSLSAALSLLSESPVVYLISIEYRNPRGGRGLRFSIPNF